MSPVLWLIGHPWPKEAAIQAAAPLPLAYCRSTAIGDAEGDCDDWGSRTWRAVSLLMGAELYARAAATHEAFGQGAAGFGRVRTKWKRCPRSIKGGPCRIPPRTRLKCEDVECRHG